MSREPQQRGEIICNRRFGATRIYTNKMEKDPSKYDFANYTRYFGTELM
jgi:hypothetical protein